MLRGLWMMVVLMGAMPAVAQDLEAGERSFRKCMPCHDVGPAAKHKVGPILNGLQDRKAGTMDGYSYSNANKNSGIVWTEQSFVTYIRSPQAAIPSTKMAFVGIPNEKERSDLWAFLRQFQADGGKH